MRDYSLFIPEFIAGGLAAAIIAAELFWPSIRRETLAYLTALAAVAWGVASLFYAGNDPESFQGLIQIDNFTTFFRLMGAGIVAVVALLSAQFLSGRTKTASEYYGLLLVAGCAMVYMASARELITAYIAL